jgi:hypothetical protein
VLEFEKEHPAAFPKGITEMEMLPHHPDDDNKRHHTKSRSRMLVKKHIPHNTISALTQFLGHSVPIIHDEVLVENLEDFPSL